MRPVPYLEYNPPDDVKAYASTLHHYKSNPSKAIVVSEYRDTDDWQTWIVGHHMSYTIHIRRTLNDR